MAQHTGNYEDVTTLNARLANIGTGSGYALGLETETGLLNITATGAALGMPAPVDVDDLLQNGRGEEVRLIRHAVKENTNWLS
jgi:hypothetical protein